MKKLSAIAFKDTIPVMSGYIVLGITFGILLKKAGFDILWALLISIFVYAGSMQFVLISLLTGGASIISVALTTLTVNARHLFYGLSMIEKYRNIGKVKPYLMFTLTDETYSLVCNKPRNTDKKYYILVSLINHIYWVLGTALGSLLWNIISIDVTGLEFSMTALFVVVVVEQWLSIKKHSSVLIGFICSIVCLMIFGAGNFLIPTMISILVILSITYKKQGGKANE